MVDYQKIRIQELQDRDGLNRDEGRMPRTIDVDLCDDLVDSVIPGDIVAVNGIVRVTRIEAKGGGKRGRASQVLFFMYLSATSITNPRNNSDNPEKEAIELNNMEMRDMIARVLNKPDPFCFLVHSACPNIFGNEFVKSGMLLTLFGGTQKKRIGPKGGSETVSVRPDCHLLVVGDPGLGKSQMLKGMCRIAPRSVYVCGNTTTTAGLTVTVVRESSGEFALEAGALVLGDGGVCCIDEFDKMSAEHAALLEAMEQQSVSVAKAGLVCNLSARTSVIAAANPHGGQYDRSRTVSENLKLAQPLLSRFDLIFILLDRQDAERDRNISNHVMKTFGMRQSGFAGPSPMHGAQATQVLNPFTMPPTAGGTQKRKTLLDRMKSTKFKDPLPPYLFRQYIAYARTYVNPQLSDGAKEVLKEFYLKLRKEAKKQDTTPVTTRQLESLIRLAEARARAEMRTVVTADDAQDVVDIMSQSMLETLTNEHGEVDLSRNNGMSRAKDAQKFRQKLFAESRRTRSALFSKSKLRSIAESIGITGDRLERAIETLNVQGDLLKKGGGMWEMKSSSFSQAF